MSRYVEAISGGVRPLQTVKHIALFAVRHNDFAQAMKIIARRAAIDIRQRRRRPCRCTGNKQLAETTLLSPTQTTFAHRECILYIALSMPVPKFLCRHEWRYAAVGFIKQFSPYNYRWSFMAKLTMRPRAN